ncbi:MAG TPA: hypothetical protein VGV40_00840, partial [Solirubrobacteraceae bacterium]|nr:hypothetical protein [Solirubrobacteraceae bacterium]
LCVGREIAHGIRGAARSLEELQMTWAGQQGQMARLVAQRTQVGKRVLDRSRREEDPAIGGQRTNDPA